MRAYVPKRGDIVWLTFDPQAGHEQAGRRPALVLSPEVYNRKVGLALLCPISNQRKGYPFEVELSSEIAITGVVLADQLKTLDWRSRRATFAVTAPREVLEEVLAKALTLLAPED